MMEGRQIVRPRHGWEDDNNIHLKVTIWTRVTYLLTPWCRVLLQKLTGLQLVKKLPAFQGTRRFITALKSVRHLSLSWACPIQSIYPHPTSWRSILKITHVICSVLHHLHTRPPTLCKRRPRFPYLH